MSAAFGSSPQDFPEFRILRNPDPPRGTTFHRRAPFASAHRHGDPLALPLTGDVSTELFLNSRASPKFGKDPSSIDVRGRTSGR
jgi:hypothetical protein